MGAFRHASAVIVLFRAVAVLPRQRRVGQALPVISDGKLHQIRHKGLVHQLQNHLLGHLPHDQPRFLKIIGRHQHLPRADAVRGGTVSLDVFHPAALGAPGMVDQKLGIDAEEPVEKLGVVHLALPPQRTARHVAHSVQAVLLQLFRDPPAHTPEIRQRAVLPQRPAVAHLVQLGDAHAVLIRGHVLGHNVHGDLGQVQIRADPDGGGDACGCQHVPHNGHGVFARALAAGADIIRRVQKNLVNGVDVDVLRRGIFQIDLIDPRAVFDIKRHARRRDNIVKLQRRIFLQLTAEEGTAGKDAARRAAAPDRIDLADAFHSLEQTRPAGDPIGLEGGGDGETDCLFRARGVCDHKTGVQRIEAAFATLHRGVKAFQVDGDIGPILRFPHLRFSQAHSTSISFSFQEMHPSALSLKRGRKRSGRSGPPLRPDLV